MSREKPNKQERWQLRKLIRGLCKQCGSRPRASWANGRLKTQCEPCNDIRRAKYARRKAAN